MDEDLASSSPEQAPGGRDLFAALLGREENKSEGVLDDSIGPNVRLVGLIHVIQTKPKHRRGRRGPPEETATGDLGALLDKHHVVSHRRADPPLELEKKTPEKHILGLSDRIRQGRRGKGGEG